MIGARNRDKVDVQKPIAQVSRRHSARDHEVSAGFRDGLLRPRQNHIRYLNLRAGTADLQFRDDVEQTRARESRVDDQLQFAFPSLFQASRQRLQRIEFLDQRPSAS